jgi:O-antigen ligase
MAKYGIRIAGYDSPLAGDPNDLALTLNLILALVIGLCLAAETATKRLLLLAVIGFLAAGVIASFSRGGFLTLVAILIVFAAKRVRQRGPMAIALPLILLLVALPILPEGYGDRVYTIFNTAADTTGSADARWEGMVLGFQLMLERPLTGFGLNMHALEFPERGLGWQGTHSAFIQIGADLGVPGFLVYLLLIMQLFRGIRQSLKQLRPSPQGRALVALGTGIHLVLVAYLVGGFLLPVAYRFYFYYAAGLAVAFHEIAKRESSTVAAAEPGKGRLRPASLQVA